MHGRKQVDYLLVLKYSQKYNKNGMIIHTSKEEPRIIRIDWGNKQIKYYGDESIFKINDYLAPREYPLETKFPVNQIASKILNPPNAAKKFISQLIQNGYGHSLLSLEEMGLSGFDNLIIHMKKSGLFPEDYSQDQINEILDVLDSSILKNKWIETIKANPKVLTYLENISIESKQAHLKKLMNKPTLNEKTTAYQYITNDMEKFKNSNVFTSFFEVNIPTNTGSNIVFNFNRDLLLSSQSQNNSERAKFKISNCGAENCYYIVKDNNNKQFGLRISSNVYLDSDYGVYNLIIENLINCILHFYFTNPALIGEGDSSIAYKLPEISAVLRFGFIKVKFTNSNDEELIGYIPYTLTEYKPTYKTLMSQILELCDLPPEQTIDKCKIEVLIKNILTQVYNFYVIARPYFKFNHNDFKTNNILINTETGKIYIIDFGYAQINFSNGTRTFNLTNRLDFYEYADGMYNEYEFLIKNINDIYTTDNDIETLLYWLINPYEFYEKSTRINPNNVRNANKFRYHEIAKSILELMSPITQKKPQASRDAKSLLGHYLFKCPELKYPISLIEYRLYQSYILLTRVPSECSYKPFLIDTYNKDKPYIKYFLGFNETKYLEYKQFIDELTGCAKSKEIPEPKSTTDYLREDQARAAATSGATNSLVGGRIRKTKTYKNARKRKSKINKN